AEGHRQMARPAERRVRREDPWQLLGGHAGPLARRSVRRPQRGRLLVPGDRPDLALADRAALLRVPRRHDVPHQAVRGGRLDLADAGLIAADLLGPAGAVAKAERSDEGIDDADVDGGGGVVLGAGDEALSWTHEKRVRRIDM